MIVCTNWKCQAPMGCQCQSIASLMPALTFPGVKVAQPNALLQFTDDEIFAEAKRRREWERWDIHIQAHDR